MIPVIDAEIDFNFDYLSIDRTFEIIIPSASSKLREQYEHPQITPIKNTGSLE